MASPRGQKEAKQFQTDRTEEKRGPASPEVLGTFEFRLWSRPDAYQVSRPFPAIEQEINSSYFQLWLSSISRKTPRGLVKVNLFRMGRGIFRGPAANSFGSLFISISFLKVYPRFMGFR